MSLSKVEDASDRAQRKRKHGELRIPLDQIGFWPGNRGGFGLSAAHAHEVVWDCVANKVKRQRYHHVDLVEIHPDQRAKIQEANKRKADDPLMPQCPSDIKFACMSKTHLVHGLKLAKDGGRTIMNEGNIPIKLQEDDSEGALILSQGPVCAIYDSSLLEDEAAARALASEDNLNASVAMEEDEMQAFGRVSVVFERMVQDSQNGTHAPVTPAQILDHIRQSGTGQFSTEEWVHLISLRSTLSVAHAQVLQTCQFEACASRVRVRASDFGLTAKLDPRASWAKVGVILFQYLNNTDLKKKHTENATVTFSGRKVKKAPPLSREAFTLLAQESFYVMGVESYIIKILGQYPGQASGARSDALLSRRGEFLANCGRHVVRVGAVLDQAVKKAKLRGTVLTPDDRAELIEKTCIGSFGKAEKEFRNNLVESKVYENESLPEALYCDTSGKETADGNETADGKETAAKAQGAGSVMHCQLAAAGTLTQNHVFKRLNIKGCNEKVLAHVDPGAEDDVKSEAGLAKEECSDTESGPAPLLPANGLPGEDVPDQEDARTADALGYEASARGRKREWIEATLVSIDVPEAIVEVNLGCSEKKNPKKIKLTVDDLRPVPTTNNKDPKDIHPSLRDVGDDHNVLGVYDYGPFSKVCAKIAAQHALQWLHLMTQSSVRKVDTVRLSAVDKTPITLQARARESIKKGSLMLAPALGEIVFDDGDAVALRKSSKGAIHEAMNPEMYLTVRVGPPVKGKKRALDQEGCCQYNFVVRSPLLAGKKKDQLSACFDNVNPFWGLLRASGLSAKPNMQIDRVLIRDVEVDTRHCSDLKAPKNFEIWVEVPVAKSVSNLEKGEVLTLPYHEESAGED